MYIRFTLFLLILCTEWVAVEQIKWSFKSCVKLSVTELLCNVYAFGPKL